jgi:hypothetical protein
MPVAAPIQLSFSSGELSNLFDGRVDLEEYGTGCRSLKNFIPMIQGPAERRGGTRFVREVKDSTDRCGYLRFEFNVEQAYVLEVGDQYIRFYTDHGIVMNGTNPLELAAPWIAADLFDSEGNFLLESVQSGDILYITHTNGLYRPKKLTRSGALSWSLTDFIASGGPFEDIDPDETITVYASAATGSVSLVASAPIFESGDIGTLFLLEQRNSDDTPAWEAGKSITANSVRRVDNRNYVALTTATAGGIAPVHTRGDAVDGDPGVQWRFLDPGYGWGVITAVASSGSSATLTVQSRLPAGVVGSGDSTTRWAFGAWSSLSGWPTHVTFFRERLTFARAQTREFWMSETGDFEMFRSRDDGGLTVADSAIRGEVTSDQANRIQWLSPQDALIIGTAGDEFAIFEITTTEPLGPGNVKAVPNSAYGSKPVRPVKVGDAVLFVQRSGRKLRDLTYTIEKEKFVSTNLNVLAPHLFPKGKSIISMAYQQEPHSVIWALRNDGVLLGATLNVNQRRFGWHRHPIGGDGIVEALAVIPNPAADADEVWLIVKRTIDGVTKRYVEYMEPAIDSDEDVIESFYVDSGLTFDGAVNATLTPGTGATVAGTAGVSFVAGSSVFMSADVDREIWLRHFTGDEWRTARAKITAYVSGTTVTCTIISAFPSTSLIPANGWRMTVESISGLSHLEGETVKILADGATHPDRDVASGTIVLQRKSTYVHIGLNAPASLQTMQIEAGAAQGTAQGRIKRIHKGKIRLINTVGGRAGPNLTEADSILFRSASNNMDEALQMFSGDKEVAWPDGYNVSGYQFYENNDPLPATVVAFLPELHTQG